MAPHSNGDCCFGIQIIRGLAMNNPKTPKEARELKFATTPPTWSNKYKPGKCCAALLGGTQCYRKAISGPHGFHCKQHGRMVEDEARPTRANR